MEQAKMEENLWIEIPVMSRKSHVLLANGIYYYMSNAHGVFQ